MSDQLMDRDLSQYTPSGDSMKSNPSGSLALAETRSMLNLPFFIKDKVKVASVPTGPFGGSINNPTARFSASSDCSMYLILSTSEYSETPLSFMVSSRLSSPTSVLGLDCRCTTPFPSPTGICSATPPVNVALSPSTSTSVLGLKTSTLAISPYIFTESMLLRSCSASVPPRNVALVFTPVEKVMSPSAPVSINVSGCLRVFTFTSISVKLPLVAAL